MAKIKIGINGFGRIGRFVFRSTFEENNVNDVVVVGINDLLPVDYMAYMLKYDTMHGQFNGTIEVDAERNELIVNGNRIRVTAEKDPANLKWDEVGAEYVVESTGLFLAMDKAEKHLEAGAKYVVLSAPSKAGEDGRQAPMFVCGVNTGHRERLDDHRALHHRHPEDRRRSVDEGLARRSCRFGQHHPLEHRCSKGCGQGDS